MNLKGIVFILLFLILGLIIYFVSQKYAPATNMAETPISRVTPFSFTNQYGKIFTDAGVKNKIYVAEFFFTTCRAICPVMHKNMKKVYDHYKNEQRFMILSFTCDPETDSVPQIKKYADSLGVNTYNWIFLTGNKDSLYSMAKNSYKIDDPDHPYSKPGDDFIHTQMWALVNTKGEVIKTYNGLKDEDVNLIIKDIDKLLK